MAIAVTPEPGRTRRKEDEEDAAALLEESAGTSLSSDFLAFLPLDGMSHVQTTCPATVRRLTHTGDVAAFAILKRTKDRAHAPVHCTYVAARPRSQSHSCIRLTAPFTESAFTRSDSPLLHGS